MAAPENPRLPPSQVAVVIVPLPAQGHLNQLLHLSHRIAAYGIPVHYVCTAAHLQQAKLRLHGWDPLSSTNLAAAGTLSFHEFPIPKFSSPIPNPNATNKFPSHLQPLFDAASHLRPPLAALLRRLTQTSGRVIVIHDATMSSVVQDVESIPNAESYIFHAVSAFCSFSYFNESLENPFPVDEHLQAKIPSMEDCFTSEFTDFIEYELKFVGLSSGNLFNSCRVVESPFLDLIDKLFEGKKSWAIGPLNPVNLTGNQNPAGDRHDCLKWLDNQEPKSVIYISFGTTVSLPEEQIKELEMGLKESGLKFVWVVRGADRGDCRETESENRGSSSEVKLGSGERGIRVRDWAPQLEILRHSAIGGFLSHCGWNSCMESISAGVAVATWPMHSDQPRNAVLMTDVLKTGFAVKEWAKRDGIVEWDRISGVLRRLMESEEGKEVQRRAEELGVAVREAAVGKGGVTRQQMDSFIAHICR